VAGFPSFLVGLIEDLTKKVKIHIRFTLTILSGLFFCVITGFSLTHIHIDFIDSLLSSYAIISFLFTAFAISGITNSINIIDGLNGLAGFITIFLFCSVCAIAYKVGNYELAISCISLIGSILGFLIINWPFGKIFLGDGGSYFCGFALATSCIQLVEMNASISPFAPLLICVYPISEVVFSIYRRLSSSDNPTGPDALHLHTLIFRRYFLNKNIIFNKNSIAGLIVGLFSLMPAICAYLFCESSMYCIILIIIFVSCYVGLYKRIIKFKWL
jgi:UDP-N-acetylmuramyl pentapeptide phosphotransferase/UDP-N-acetylglucosamine-1-phosphate transferase